MIQAIGAFFKIVFFFLKLTGESNKAKAKEKAEIGKELVDAMAETNKARRASHVNAAIGRMHNLR